MHAQGIITLHILFTTLNTTNLKIGSMQEERKAMGVKINILARDGANKNQSQCKDNQKIFYHKHKYGLSRDSGHLKLFSR